MRPNKFFNFNKARKSLPHPRETSLCLPTACIFRQGAVHLKGTESALKSPQYYLLRQLKNYSFLRHTYLCEKSEYRIELLVTLLDRSALGSEDDLEMKIDFVRNVAPKKNMYRITIPLNNQILFDESSSNDTRNGSCSSPKRQKIES